MLKLKIMLSAAAALAIVAATAQTANAAPRDRFLGVDSRISAQYTPRIDRRMRNQYRRIRRARRNGRLTRFEAWRVRGGLATIRQAKRWAARDGYIDRRERRWVLRMLNRNSRLINRLVRNGNRVFSDSEWFRRDVPGPRREINLRF